MRARKLNRAGRILVYFLSFLMAFSGASTFCIQAVQAAVNTADIQGKEDLRGMLSVASVLYDNWETDKGLQDLLTKRDIDATEYSKENNMLGIYTKSESLGKEGDSGEWVSNVMYEGTVLRAGSFIGYHTSYEDGDSAVIKEGLNEFEIDLTPAADTKITDEGEKTDIKTWEKQYDFASRFMLPPLTSDGTLDLKKGTAYHTKLFIVGIKNRGNEVNRIYSGDLMSYVDYLKYTASDPKDANMLSYLAYVEAFRNIQNDRSRLTYGLNDWQQWAWRCSLNFHHSSHDHDSKSRKPSTPSTPSKPTTSGDERVVMIYMDAADMTGDAISNLQDMIEASTYGKGLSADGKARVYIITGGANGTSKEIRDREGVKSLFGSDNQIWQLVDGTLKRIDTDNHLVTDTDMTDPQTLARFIKTVSTYDRNINDYDRTNVLYDLILWSHAGGPETGFGQDMRFGKGEGSMSVSEIVQALKEAKESGVLFDFIAFDSCYMSNVEVAMALAPYADYLLGAEGKMPQSGLEYLSLIRSLINDPGIESMIRDSNGNITGGLVKQIVDACASQYDGLEGDPLREIAYSAIELDRFTTSSDSVTDALIDFSETLYAMITGADGRESRYKLLKYREKFTAEENKIGHSSNDLVDLYTFCQGLRGVDSRYEYVCSRLCDALKDSMYGVQVSDGGDAGAAPNGISIYFPSNWRKIYTSNDDTGVTEQIEALLGVYQSINSNSDAFDAYGRAIASYGLWLKTGELMRQYWDDTQYLTEDQYKAAVKAGLNNYYEDEDGKKLLDKVRSYYQDDDSANAMINSIFEAQINDCIKKSNVLVEAVKIDDGHGGTTDSYYEKMLTVDNVDPDFVDRVEVKISISDVKDSHDGTDLGEVSLGYSDHYATKDAAETTDDKVVYDVNRFDNRWLKLNGEVVSYYDTQESEEGFRRGIIPVAYWVGDKLAAAEADKDGYMHITEAIEKGYLILGVFEVEFNNIDNVDEGRILRFRTVADDSIQGISYDVKNGEKYEKIANFDNPGVDNSNLVSLGTLKIPDDDTSPIVNISDVSDKLSVEYRIVDAFESRYELNGENFPDSNDGTENIENPNNLDDFQVDQQSTKTTITASKYVKVPDSSTDDSSKRDDSKASSGRDPAQTGTGSGEVTDIPTTTADELLPATTDPTVPGTADLTQEMIDQAIESGLVDPSTVPGMDTDLNVATNPLTGESIAVPDTNMENNTSDTDTSTEYVVPGLSNEEESVSSGEGDSSGGDPGDGGSDGGNDGGDDGGDSDSGSDGGSDSGSSDSSSSDSGDAE